MEKDLFYKNTLISRKPNTTSELKKVMGFSNSYFEELDHAKISQGDKERILLSMVKVLREIEQVNFTGSSWHLKYNTDIPRYSIIKNIGFDHPFEQKIDRVDTSVNTNKRLLLLASPEIFGYEPYNLDLDNLINLVLFCKTRDLSCTLTGRSFHYPGETLRVEFREVK